MNREDFIIHVYRLICDEYAEISRERRLRRGGFEPAFTHEEVMTVELCGECFGLNKDEAIYDHFHSYYRHFFPKLPERSLFVRQAAVDQGYTGDEPAQATAKQGIDLVVVKLPEAKKGFVLLPKRWVVERSFAWLARFRRLTRDYERLPQTLAGLHFVAFAMLMAHHFVHLLTQSP